MKLSELMNVHNPNHQRECLSIEGYCNDNEYDYWELPPKEVEDFIGDNPRHSIPTCLHRESWWNEAKKRTVKSFSIHHYGDKVELYIRLK